MFRPKACRKARATVAESQSALVWKHDEFLRDDANRRVKKSTRTCLPNWHAGRGVAAPRIVTRLVEQGGPLVETFLMPALVAPLGEFVLPCFVQVVRVLAQDRPRIGKDPFRENLLD